MAAAIQRRLAGTLDDKLNTQFGFGKNRSTADALFDAKRMMECAEITGQKGLMMLLGWEKAFDKSHTNGYSKH